MTYVKREKVRVVSIVFEDRDVVLCCKPSLTTLVKAIDKGLVWGYPMAGQEPVEIDKSRWYIGVPTMDATSIGIAVNTVQAIVLTEPREIENEEETDEAKD